MSKYFRHIKYRNESFAMVYTQEYYYRTVKIYNKEYNNDPQILNRYFGMVQTTNFNKEFYWFMKYNVFFCEQLLRSIQKYHEHGIIVKHKLENMCLRYVPKKSTHPPATITLKVLSVGFYIWLGCVAVACFIFVCEQLIFYYQSRESSN